MRTKKTLLNLFLFGVLFGLSSSMLTANEGTERGRGQSGGLNKIDSFRTTSMVSVSPLSDSSFGVSFFKDYGLVEIIVFGADGSEVYAETIDTSIFGENVINIGSSNGSSVMIISDETGAVINESPLR